MEIVLQLIPAHTPTGATNVFSRFSSKPSAVLHTSRELWVGGDVLHECAEWISEFKSGGLLRDIIGKTLTYQSPWHCCAEHCICMRSVIFHCNPIRPWNFYYTWGSWSWMGLSNLPLFPQLAQSSSTQQSRLCCPPLASTQGSEWVTETTEMGFRFWLTVWLTASPTQPDLSEKSVITPGPSGILADSGVISELQRLWGDGVTWNYRLFDLPKLSWKTDMHSSAPSLSILFSLMFLHLLLPCLVWSLYSLKNLCFVLFFSQQFLSKSLPQPVYRAQQ